MVLKRNKLALLWILTAVIILAGIYITVSFHQDRRESGAAMEADNGLKSYTVETGDTIFHIAGKYGVSIAALKNINSLHLDLITPGQILTIPDKPSGDWYTVTKGDSLYYLATKYEVAVNALQKSNELTSDLITPGQVLIIPEKTASSVSPVEKSRPIPKKQWHTFSNNLGNQPLAVVLKEKGIRNPWSRMAILIDKSAHTLTLYGGGVWLKSYPVEFGDGGPGDKEVQGDHKTPEGNFYIAEKSVLQPADQFLGSRWLRLSYPNTEDAERGIHQGLIDWKTHEAIIAAWKNKGIPPQYTALGGGVGIHGGNSKEQGNNWTWGCIGLSNKDIEDFFDFVTVGTPIIVQK